MTKRFAPGDPNNDDSLRFLDDVNDPPRTALYRDQKTKTAAQLDAEIAACLADDDGTSNLLPPWQQTNYPLTTRRAWLIKALLEEPKIGGKVTIGELTSNGGHSLIIEHPPSGFWERFGVSKYGITPAEVRFGSSYKGADKFMKKKNAALNKAKKLT